MTHVGAETSTNASALPQLTDPAVALHATQYSEWYPRYEAIAPRSIVIDVAALEPNFLQWLDADGLVLPKDSGVSRPSDQKRRDDQEVDAMSLPSDDDDEDAPELPALTDAIRHAISKYGAVFPKVNWSAPLDAAWMVPGNTLECKSPSDVYLLLKSSDFVARDMEQVAELALAVPSVHPVLVLKQWSDQPHAHEFRCFVRAGRLVALCQRDITFYAHLQNNDVKDQIRRTIADFYTKYLAADPLKDCMFDVHLDAKLRRTTLIDINPWLPRTDTLLWTYQELDEAAIAAASTEELPPLRLIVSEAQASQSQPTYCGNMVPADVMEVGAGRNVAEFAREWQNYLSKASSAEDP